MKSISGIKKIALFPFLLCVFLCACGKQEVPLSYGTLENNRFFSMEKQSDSVEAPFFAKDLCATAEDITDSSSINASELNAACIYDLNRLEVAYSYHANEKLSPASLTKIMTALVVLDNCPDLNEVVTIGNVSINESGAQLFGFSEGDRISLKNLLYATVIYSANDGALALAEHVAGGEEGFVQMMNDKAAELGATNTHFTNPHGLTSDEHYTTAYDLYLMFNAAIRYPEFLEMIRTDRMTVEYTAADGSLTSKDILTTNRFLTENYGFEDGIEIIGGKTGSTNAAGKCIILYALDGSSSPYIAVVMGAADADGLYRTAKQLIEDTLSTK